jgi:predicted TPR repeat methyltransferase
MTEITQTVVHGTTDQMKLAFAKQADRFNALMMSVQGTADATVGFDVEDLMSEALGHVRSMCDQLADLGEKVGLNGQALRAMMARNRRVTARADPSLDRS